MLYSLLADAVLLLHFVFVLFVGIGGFLALRWRILLCLHIPAVLWAVWISCWGSLCPLTPLEQWLRRQDQGHSYAGSFTDRYISPVIYPEGLTQEMQWWIGLFVLLLNLSLYLWLFSRWKNRKRFR